MLQTDGCMNLNHKAKNIDKMLQVTGFKSSDLKQVKVMGKHDNEKLLSSMIMKQDFLIFPDTTLKLKFWWKISKTSSDSFCLC